MKIGFTGTKYGMTLRQRNGVKFLVEAFEDQRSFQENSPSNEYHHGDCVGSDEEFHGMILRYYTDIIIHPPTKDKFRAFCSVEPFGICQRCIREPKDYGIRDRDIVDQTDILIATPRTVKEEVRSGTWMTIRYARTTTNIIYIIEP